MQKPESTCLPTIIVPVFNAFSELTECLSSLARCSPEANILIIDDASDDVRVSAMLREWSTVRSRVRLIRRERNRGFVNSVNLGIAETTGDVVLLNSDTVVTPGWLSGLSDCLASDRAIASATPWSNNAEILSIPAFCVNNPMPEDPDRIARAVAQSARGIHPNLPTAVGFCMAMSRDAIEQIGCFDETTFGHGYGEENDWSLRADKAGLRNVLCETVYVVHQGGASFGPLDMKPGDASMQRLLAKHPDYLERVMAWIEDDPLAGRRQAIADQLVALESGKIKA